MSIYFHFFHFFINLSVYFNFLYSFSSIFVILIDSQGLLLSVLSQFCLILSVLPQMNVNPITGFWPFRSERLLGFRHRFAARHTLTGFWPFRSERPFEFSTSLVRANHINTSKMISYMSLYAKNKSSISDNFSGRCLFMKCASLFIQNI